MSTESKRMAKLYFKKESGKLAKDMAARIRSQDSLCNLIDQQHFEGPEHVEQAALVLIQQTAKKAQLIATCYEKFGADSIKVAFFDDEGNVCDGNKPQKPETISEPVAEEPGADTGDTGAAEGCESVSEGNPESDGIPTDD